MMYYIFEVQNRADGVNNVLDVVGRQSLATGLSYFYDRCSKMSATTLYPTVSILLINSEGVVIKNERIKTAWVEPTEGGDGE